MYTGMFSTVWNSMTQMSRHGPSTTTVRPHHCSPSAKLASTVSVSVSVPNIDAASSIRAHHVTSTLSTQLLRSSIRAKAATSRALVRAVVGMHWEQRRNWPSVKQFRRARVRMSRHPLPRTRTAHPPVIDPTPKQCHFCGQQDTPDSDLQWWNLQEYRSGLTGLACPRCMARFKRLSDKEVADIITSRLVAQKLEPQ